MRFAVSDLHPVAREFIAALGRIGHRAASAAISTALKGAAEIGNHFTDALTKSAEAAEKMAAGKPYENPFEEEEKKEDP
jgi:hypothetical protein